MNIYGMNKCLKVIGWWLEVIMCHLSLALIVVDYLVEKMTDSGVGTLMLVYKDLNRCKNTTVEVF